MADDEAPPGYIPLLITGPSLIWACSTAPPRGHLIISCNILKLEFQTWSKVQHKPLLNVSSMRWVFELKWGASSRRSSPLYCLMRNSNGMTIGKTRPTLRKGPFLLQKSVWRSLFSRDGLASKIWFWSTQFLSEIYDQLSDFDQIFNSPNFRKFELLKSEPKSNFRSKSSSSENGLLQTLFLTKKGTPAYWESARRAFSN